MSRDRGSDGLLATPPGAPRPRPKLTGAQETLVIPLYAKALDARSRGSILHDRWADELVRSIDVDFERLHTPGNTRVLAARARQLDEWIRPYVRAHPACVVLNLGCGLDTRVLRIRPPPSVAWIDVDFPDVIELRRAFFAERPGYQQVGASLTEPGWLVPLPRNRPVLVVAEGVLEYLPEEEVRGLLRRLGSTFPHGEAIFDVMDTYAARMGNARMQGRVGARLRWAVDDLSQVDGYLPAWRRTATVSALRSRYLPWSLRFVYRLAGVSPELSNAIRLVRYEW